MTALTGKLKEIPKEVINKVLSVLGAVLNKRTLIIGLGGLFVILLLLLIGIFVSRSRSRRANDTTQAMSLGLTIPVEDLFFPSEPEFLPEFLLEQEPRSYWSIEDIRAFWIAPANHEIWRREIRSAAERILEGAR